MKKGRTESEEREASEPRANSTHQEISQKDPKSQSQENENDPKNHNPISDYKTFNFPFKKFVEDYHMSASKNKQDSEQEQPEKGTQTTKPTPDPREEQREENSRLGLQFQTQQVMAIPGMDMQMQRAMNIPDEKEVISLNEDEENMDDLYKKNRLDFKKLERRGRKRGRKKKKDSHLVLKRNPHRKIFSKEELVSDSERPDGVLSVIKKGDRSLEEQNDALRKLRKGLGSKPEETQERRNRSKEYGRKLRNLARQETEMEMEIVEDDFSNCVLEIPQSVSLKERLKQRRTRKFEEIEAISDDDAVPNQDDLNDFVSGTQAEGRRRSSRLKQMRRRQKRNKQQEGEELEISETKPTPEKEKDTLLQESNAKQTEHKVETGQVKAEDGFQFLNNVEFEKEMEIVKYVFKSIVDRVKGGSNAANLGKIKDLLNQESRSGSQEKKGKSTSTSESVSKIKRHADASLEKEQSPEPQNAKNQQAEPGKLQDGSLQNEPNTSRNFEIKQKAPDSEKFSISNSSKIDMRPTEASSQNNLKMDGSSSPKSKSFEKHKELKLPKPNQNLVKMLRDRESDFQDSVLNYMITVQNSEDLQALKTPEDALKMIQKYDQFVENDNLEFAASVMFIIHKNFNSASSQNLLLLNIIRICLAKFLNTTDSYLHYDKAYEMLSEDYRKLQDDLVASYKSFKMNEKLKTIHEMKTKSNSLSKFIPEGMRKSVERLGRKVDKRFQAVEEIVGNYAEKSGYSNLDNNSEESTNQFLPELDGNNIIIFRIYLDIYRFLETTKWIWTFWIFPKLISRSLNI